MPTARTRRAETGFEVEGGRVVGGFNFCQEVVDPAEISEARWLQSLNLLFSMIRMGWRHRQPRTSDFEAIHGADRARVDSKPVGAVFHLEASGDEGAQLMAFWDPELAGPVMVALEKP